MNIIPITITQVNWIALTKGAERFIGQSPTRILDDNGITVGSPESYLSTLTCFANIFNDPKNILESSMEHVNISFLINIERSFYYHLLEYIHKDTLILRTENFNSPDEVVIIVTTTLLNWRNYSHTLSHSYKMKEFSYKIYETLKKLGYNNIFNNYKIEENLDGSKQLTKR